MATRTKSAPPARRAPASRRAAHEGKVRNEFWLDPRVLAEARAALLVSANARDLARIARVFAFEYVVPYPTAP